MAHGAVVPVPDYILDLCLRDRQPSTFETCLRPDTNRREIRSLAWMGTGTEEVVAEAIEHRDLAAARADVEQVAVADHPKALRNFSSGFTSRSC